MSRFEIGIQMWPWYSIKTLVSYAERALEFYPFDQIWMCDEFQYEDSFTVLAAMAMRLNVSVGTMVTFPHRNPMELAQRFSGIAGVVHEGKEVSAGIGAGGAVQEQVVNEKTAPMAVMEETTRFLTTLFAGQSVDLKGYPRLSERFRYNARTQAKLYFPPRPAVPVYLAAGGPKMFDMAGRLGDGVILTQLNPWTSLPGIQRGTFQQAIEMISAARKTAAGNGAFKKIYNLHISVSADGDKARQWAKRNTSYGLAGSSARYPDVLEAIGVNLKDVELVREAYVKGLGVEEAARRVSDKLLEDAGFIVAGTPREVLAKCEAILPRVRDFGVDQLVVGVPLGPNVPEALDIISKEIIPA
ncbi:MAG TPA: LLM class flavin-dependent oxidoreductase, partial [Methylomirabilota bacterium]|nr:LLM class flavin-dependent oxidoreductase [Methylomirabilota bacterium]